MSGKIVINDEVQNLTKEFSDISVLLNESKVGLINNLDNGYKWTGMITESFNENLEGFKQKYDILTNNYMELSKILNHIISENLEVNDKIGKSLGEVVTAIAVQGEK